jgi:hypothetical protein
VGNPAPILDSAQKQRLTIRQQRRGRVKHSMNRIRPIGGGEDRVEFMAAKNFGVLLIH